MTDFSAWIPPAWAIPLYIFETTCLGLTGFLTWVCWPLVKESFNERLGRKRPEPRAPPVGE